MLASAESESASAQHGFAMTEFWPLSRVVGLGSTKLEPGCVQLGAHFDSHYAGIESGFDQCFLGLRQGWAGIRHVSALFDQTTPLLQPEARCFQSGFGLSGRSFDLAEPCGRVGAGFG